MPEPSQQLASVLAAQLTRADKDALDLLAAWPLCTREQLAGLMRGATLRRVNQVLRSLSQHGLVRTDGNLHMLTDEGLTYLARRDRAAMGLTLDRWSAEPAYSNPDVYAGTALRALASQSRHHAGVTGFVAALAAEVAHSPDHDLFDLLPTSRSSIGYRYDWTTYVILPDASFTLEYRGRWRPYLLEFERRATTPKRILDRLESYRRYFLSGWAKRDHGGFLPRVLFVFETPGNEEAFLDSAARVRSVPFLTSNVETLAECGVLGHSWRESPPASSSDGLNLTDRIQLRSLYPVCTMTTFAVPTTSCRGCPSIAAGTLLGEFPTHHGPYALTCSNCCRADTSGRFRTPHISLASQLWLVATTTTTGDLMNSPMRSPEHVPSMRESRSHGFL